MAALGAFAGVAQAAEVVEAVAAHSALEGAGSPLPSQFFDRIGDHENDHYDRLRVGHSQRDEEAHKERARSIIDVIVSVGSVQNI